MSWVKYFNDLMHMYKDINKIRLSQEVIRTFCKNKYVQLNILINSKTPGKLTTFSV